jgi:basic membrane lipoprotein Med (substrate-binding protein (PBP1-ABC) superfamily)
VTDQFGVAPLGVARRAAAVVAFTALLAAGCTAEPPEDPVAQVPADPVAPIGQTSLGARVGVVLPPADAWHPAVTDAMLRDVRVVQSMARQGVREIRTVTPDSEVFVADLIQLLAQDRFELTCALTTNASSVVRQQHAQLPHKRFCAVVTAPLTAEEDPGFDVVVLRIAELGYVVGTAAALAAEGGGVTYALAPHELERGRFRDGMLTALAAETVVEPDPELELVAAVLAAIGEGADVVVVGGGPQATEVAAAAVEAGAQVLVPDALAGAVDPAATVMTWRVRWDRVLRAPVDRLLDRDDGVPLSLGFAENAFVIRFGTGTPQGVNAVVGQVTEEIVTGQRDPTGNGSSVPSAPLAPSAPPGAS